MIISHLKASNAALGLSAAGFEVVDFGAHSKVTLAESAAVPVVADSKVAFAESAAGAAVLAPASATRHL